MVIDSSALIAVLQDEPERPEFNRRIAADPVRLMSAANYLEAAVRIVPVTAAQAELARAAYRRFGRGNHPARLNFGDCFAYALARETGEALLFKGEDFSRTDVTTAA
jgi:ribonuclease VapC